MSPGHRCWKLPALRAEMRRSLSMALPLIGAQILTVGNGLVDTLVAGRIGRDELAACGIGASIWLITYLFSLGLMAALSPTLASSIGRGRIDRVGFIYRQGLWLGTALGVLGSAALFGITLSTPAWGLDPTLVAPIQAYLLASLAAYLPAVIMLAPRNLCEATGQTRPVLKVQALGLLVNAGLDLGFGLGWFGFPELGLAGIGWSTSVVMLTTSAALLWRTRGRGFVRYGLYRSFERPAPPQLRDLLTLSIPICLTLIFEVGLFTATSIQMGMLGSITASAHNIAIGVTALFYMMPLGLGLALTARVGRAFGRSNVPSIRLRVSSGVLLTVAMAVTSSLLLVIFREPIAALYTDDPGVRGLAVQLLLVAAVFQLSDDLQATLLAMLRGLHDTRLPMLINAFSYWCVAFGVGYYLAHTRGYGPYGLWTGLIIGLSLSALLLGWRLRVRLRTVHVLMSPQRQRSP